MVLGITVLAEAVGKALLSTGLTSQIRPKKYYTVSRETLNALIGDVHELLNFFVIEAQQIIFAENLFLSSAVSLLSASDIIVLINSGFPWRFPLLLLDQGCPILGSFAHFDIYPVPRTPHLQDKPRAHRPPRFQC